jgi:hypothetical protein
MTRLRRFAVLAVCCLSFVSLTNLPRAGAQTGALTVNRVQKYTEIGQVTPSGASLVSADGNTAIVTMWGAAFVWSPAGKVPVEYEGQPLTLQDLSADGRVAVGYTSSKAHPNKKVVIHFLRWTREKGMEEIFPADANTTGDLVSMKVSPDGRTVIAGVTDGDRKRHARMMRWVEGQGVKSEVVPQGWGHAPIAMSSDGSVVWGKYFDQSSTVRVFRWSEPEGAKEISDDFNPISVSADGKVAYGRGISDRQEIYRWTVEKGRELILDLETIYPKQPLDASVVLNDGTTIMGHVDEKVDDKTTHRHVFRWTKADGFQILAFPEETYVWAFAASSDGKVVSAEFKTEHDQTLHFAVTPVADLLAMVAAKERKAGEAQAALVQAAAQAKAEADQKEADLQAQAEKAMQGHPAQMYSFALRMEKEKRFDIAEKVYAALIEKYPDDPYTAKAIDRQEQAIEEEKAEKKAQQEALAQQAQDQQNAAAHEVAANSCRSQCQSQYDSCASDVQAQSNKNTANFVVGMMTKNSSMASQSVNDASNAGSLGDCTSAQNSCVAACR